MRPAKTVHIPRHIKGFPQKPTVEPLEPETPQVPAGTVPVNAVELGHKGRSWTAR